MRLSAHSPFLLGFPRLLFSLLVEKFLLLFGTHILKGFFSLFFLVLVCLELPLFGLFVIVPLLDTVDFSVASLLHFAYGLRSELAVLN